jgi:hypothetical protein
MTDYIDALKMVEQFWAYAHNTERLYAGIGGGIKENQH